MSVSPETPRALIGDAARIGQVLINLVRNAVKFTNEGSVCIQIECEKKTGNMVRIKASIRDTGVGIPAKKLPHVFDIFAQADGSSTRKHGGTGLGLAISKRIVELMGGRLGVESKQGQGSTFWFTLSLPVNAKTKATAHVAEGDS